MAFYQVTFERFSKIKQTALIEIEADSNEEAVSNASQVLETRPNWIDAGETYETSPVSILTEKITDDGDEIIIEGEE